MEVMIGPKHYQLLAMEEDHRLWEKIFQEFKFGFGITSKNTSEMVVTKWPELEAPFLDIVRCIREANYLIIRVWPASPQNHIDYQKNIKKSAPSFCELRESSQDSNKHDRWNTAIFSVEDEAYLELGKELGRAYEAKTGAQAIVLRNY